jgi:hypothetical protein
VATFGDAVYVDLGDTTWRAVKVTTDGWRVITDPPVRFRRSRALQPLPEPKRGESLFAIEGKYRVRALGTERPERESND